MRNEPVFGPEFLIGKMSFDEGPPASSRIMDLFVDLVRPSALFRYFCWTFPRTVVSLSCKRG